jgi:hypothetical protein
VSLDFSFLRPIDFGLSSLRDILLNPPDTVLPSFQYNIDQPAGGANPSLFGYPILPFRVIDLPTNWT